MANFVNDTLASGAFGFNNTDPTSTNNAILLPQGFRVKTRRGRVMRWFLNGAADTVAGSLYQAPAQIANHQNMAVTAASIGALVVNVTPGATAGAQNLYAEGQLIVHTTPGLGNIYGVSSHLAITSSTAFNVNLDPDDPIQVALTTSSKVDLVSNPYGNNIVTPTTISNVSVGVANYIVTAAFNGWLQTAGPCGVLINGTPAVGLNVIPSATTSGAVDIASSTSQVVGYMMVTGVSTKVQPVFLTIAW